MARPFFFGMILCLNCLTSYAQRVLYNSQDLEQPGPTQTIRTIRPGGALSSTITVVYADGHKEKILRKDIWGYEDQKSRVFRYYGKSFFQLRDVGELVRYVVPQLGVDGLLTQYTYFSKTLDSTIHGSKRRARNDSTYAR
jgi:hypothetical protein